MSEVEKKTLRKPFVETLGDSDAAAAIRAGIMCAGAEKIEVGGNVLAALPEGINLHDLEKFLPTPLRIRKEEVFEEPDSFCDYVRQFSFAGTIRVYGRLDEHLFTAQLDDDACDAPSWRTHKAELQLAISPEWKQWLEAFKHPWNQLELAEFFEDHLEQIAEPDATSLLAGIRNISAAKNWKVNSVVREGGDISFSLSEEQSGKTSSGSIPTTLTLLIAPFRSWDPISMTVHVTYRLNDSKLVFHLRGHQVDYLVAESFNKVRRHLEKELELKVLI